MARIKIAQGSRITIQVTAKNDDGSVIDLSTLDKFGFVVFKQPSKTICKFISEETTGWSDLTIDDAAEGKFSVTLESSHTKTQEPGNYDAELIVWAADGDGGNWISKTPGGKEFIELFPSPTYQAS